MALKFRQNPGNHNDIKPRVLPDEDSAALVLVVALTRVIVIYRLITLISELVALEVAVLEIRCELAVASNAEFDLRTPTTGEKFQKARNPLHGNLCLRGTSSRYKFGAAIGLEVKRTALPKVCELETYSERSRMSKTHLNFQKCLNYSAKAFQRVVSY